MNQTQLNQLLDAMSVEELKELRKEFDLRLGKLDINHAKWLEAQRHAAGFREIFDKGLNLFYGDLDTEAQQLEQELGKLVLTYLRTERDTRNEESAREEQDPLEVARAVKEARQIDGDWSPKMR